MANVREILRKGFDFFSVTNHNPHIHSSTAARSWRLELSPSNMLANNINPIFTLLLCSLVYCEYGLSVRSEMKIRSTIGL